MPDTTTETTTPSPQTKTGATSNSRGATNLSSSGYRIENRGGQNRGGSRYKISRGDQSIIGLNTADREFKGKEETIGVLRLPIEKNLKFGLI